MLATISVVSLVQLLNGAEDRSELLIFLALTLPGALALAPRWPSVRVRFPHQRRGKVEFSRFEIGRESSELRKLLADVNLERVIDHHPTLTLMPKADIYWLRQQRLVNVNVRYEFALGIPLLATLTVGELRAYASRILRRDTTWTGAQPAERVYAADAAIARRHGAQELSNALYKVEAMDGLFERFVQEQWTPVLKAGYWPPLLRGFREHFEWQQGAAAAERTSPRARARDRIAALAPLTETEDRERDDRLACELLRDHLDVDAALLPGILEPDAHLTRLRWSQVYEHVVRPDRLEWLQHYAPEYRASLLADLPHDSDSLRAWASDLRERYDDPDCIAGRYGTDHGGDERFGRDLFAAILTEALHSYGWRVRTHIYQSYVFTRGDRTLYLEDLLMAASGDYDFIDTLEQAGIQHYRVAGAVALGQG